jgi:hypothetical protein
VDIKVILDKSQRMEKYSSADFVQHADKAKSEMSAPAAFAVASTVNFLGGHL